MIRNHGFAALIGIAFFILATIYSIVTPIFESPDELWHYPFVWHLARNWELPIQDPARPQLWQQEGSQPPLYYAIAGLLTAAIPTDNLPSLIYRNPHADIGVVTADGNANVVVHTPAEYWPWQGAVLAIHLARFYSVLLGTGTVLSVYALGRLLWPEHPSTAAVAMAFVAFNPMFLFISGSVNNDNQITLLASLVLWRLIGLVLEFGGPQTSATKMPIRHFVLLGVLVGLAALSKVSGLGLVGLTVLTLLGLSWYRRSWQSAIAGTGIVGTMTALIAGWWYWRNVQLYGDWSGTANMIALMGGRPIPPTTSQLVAEIPGLMRSFWGLFGYFSVPMPAFIYRGLNLVLLVGLLGLLITALRLWLGQTALPRLWPPWLVLLGWLVILLIGFIQWTLRTPATQGRLLFPAIAALAVLWATGWVRLIPSRWHALPAVAMFSLAMWVPWGVIAPAYALPPPVATLPPSARPLGVTFGHGLIHLSGYEATLAAVRPGQALPLRLYWSGPQSITTDYTVFVHLLDENDVVVAQRNVFHGPGVYPTSQWQTKTLFRDRYVLRLPSTVYAPARARFEVGVYDHTTGVRLTTTAGSDSIRFGTIDIQPRQDADVPNPQLLLFEDSITLVGYALDRRLVTAGETISLRLYWRSRGTPRDNYKIFVHVVGQDANRIAQHDGEPQNGAAPTSQWPSELVITDDHALTVASEAPAGVYHIVVGLYEGASGRRLRLLRDGDASVSADSVTLSGIRVVSPNQEP